MVLNTPFRCWARLFTSVPQTKLGETIYDHGLKTLSDSDGWLYTPKSNNKQHMSYEQKQAFHEILIVYRDPR